MKYFVGDRVVCVRKYGEGAVPGDEGTVVWASEDSRIPPIIRWDKYRECRHNANGKVPNGHGWFIGHEHIVLFKADDLGEFTPNLAPDSIVALLGG